MVLNSAIDSKEEGPDIPKSKGMENTVNNNPEENPSLTSKMSDNSSEADFPLQTVVTWMMVSVAVGLLTIYTMVQLISNKLTQKIEHGKKEGEVDQQHKNTADISNQADGEQDTTDCDTDLQTPQENGNQSDGIYEGNAKESDSDLPHKNLMTLEDGSLKEEKSNLNILDANVEVEKTNGSFVDRIECTKCQSNDHGTSIHMGAGFSGNLSIRTEASTETEELACTKMFGSTSNHDNSNTTETVTNCRSTATLENYNINHTTPVTVNYLQTKCFSCSAEISRNNEAPIHQHVPGSNTTTASSQLSKDLTSAKLQMPEEEIPTENKIDSPDNHPPSTITCIETTVKSLSCEKPVSNDVSDSLNFLVNYHTPQDTTDGAILSKNTSQDEFIFQQDNEMATQFKTKEEIKPETPRSRYLRCIRDDPALSKSLDSQMEMLKKGCKLLEKKPSKSALRNSGSEESLKKFVHFPEDIRNIRTVHKYDSFDESRFNGDVEDYSCNVEKQRTQSFDN